MVALQASDQASDIVTIPITQALGKPKRVRLDDDMVVTARATGISFGD